MTLSDLGERALLARIRDRVPPASGDVLLGIGDDAAVVAPARRERTVLTTDALVEGVHFDRRWSMPDDIGHKALAVNLSDVAAMGATAQWALLSLVLPDSWSVDELDGLIDGFVALAARERVQLIGGNITRTTGPLVIDVTAVGSAPPRRLLLRSGGRPGDEIHVSGEIGAAAAGLEMLRAGLPRGSAADSAEPPRGNAADSAKPPRGSAAENDSGPHDSDGGPHFSVAESVAGNNAAICIARHRRPEPRLRLGRAIARTRAGRAAMDLSDGLADAARQLAAASGCGITIDAAALPIAAGARRWWEAAGRDVVQAAISGGDDYELLVAAPKSWGRRLEHLRRQVSEPVLTRIGRLTAEPAMVIERDGRREELVGGYEHFGRRQD